MTVEDGAIVRRAFGAGPAEAADQPAGDHPAAATGSDPAALEVASHAAQIADLLAAIDDGREPAVSGESGREALEIVCAVYESSRTGRPVTLSR